MVRRNTCAIIVTMTWVLQGIRCSRVCTFIAMDPYVRDYFLQCCGYPVHSSLCQEISDEGEHWEMFMCGHGVQREQRVTDGMKAREGVAEENNRLILVVFMGMRESSMDASEFRPHNCERLADAAWSH